MYVGDIVKLKRFMLMNPKETIGICYEVYERGQKEFGASFIFENGMYDGFSLKEMNDFLHLVGHSNTLEDYKYFDAWQLQTDFQNGEFDFVLKEKEFVEIDYDTLTQNIGII